MQQSPHACILTLDNLTIIAIFKRYDIESKTKILNITKEQSHVQKP